MVTPSCGKPSLVQEQHPDESRELVARMTPQAITGQDRWSSLVITRKQDLTGTKFGLPSGLDTTEPDTLSGFVVQ